MVVRRPCGHIRVEDIWLTDEARCPHHLRLPPKGGRDEVGSLRVGADTELLEIGEDQVVVLEKDDLGVETVRVMDLVES